MSAPISVCIVCRNERDRMEPCLASVQWADEIVVLDLDSTDGSQELAQRYGARVISREPVPIVEMVRNEVAAAATHDWILVLDPDERVSPGLAAYLREHVGSMDVDAFVIPRLNKDFGYAPSSPIHRYEPQLRLYRRSAVRWPEVPNKLPDVSEDRRHRLPAVDDLVLEHDRSRNVAEVLERSIRYAPLQARSMIDRGETFSARTMTQELARRLYVQIVDGKAHRDGVPGILRAATLVGFHFWVWASFWQQSSGDRTPEDDRYVRRIGTVAEYALRGAALARRPLLAARRRRG